MKIEVGKYYKTRSGNKARIYANDINDFFAIHGAVLINGDWIFFTWSLNGSFLEGDGLAGNDLISEWTKPLDFDPSCLPAWAEWIAMDKIGGWFWHESKPKSGLVEWFAIEDCGTIPAKHAPKNYTGDWKDSLHKVSDLKTNKS